MAQNYDSIVAAEAGLQYYWKLAEAAGTTNLAESVAGVNNGTVQGTVTLGQAGIPGSTDTAALFDGTTGYVSTATQIASLTAPFSVEVWFKTTSAADMPLAEFANTQTGAVTAFPTNVAISNGGVYFNENNGARFPSALSGLNDGNWHHMVGVFAANNNMLIYVDGSLRTTDSGVTAINATAGYWRLGNGLDAGQMRYFNGTLAEVAIYNVALSASQINTHSLVGHNYTVKGNAPNANASAKSLNTSGVSKKSLSTIVPGTTGATSGQLWPL